MTDTKISNLTSYTPPADTDVFPIVDVTNGITKKITFANLKSEITGDDTAFVRKTDYDANTILYATTDNTPVALTVGTNSVVGRVAGNITTLAVDSDLTSVSTSDDTVPSAKATKTALDLKALDSAVVHNTGTETIAGAKTFSSDVIVPDEAYDATNWNGSLEVPTKNAVRDKIEDLQTSLATYDYIPNTNPTSASWFTWVSPFLGYTDSGPTYVIPGWTHSGITGSFGNDNGGAGVTSIGSNTLLVYSDIPGNGSNVNYTAASSKDIRFKVRAKVGSIGSGNYFGFGFADASTTFDDAQSGTASNIRFVVDNATLYAANGNGTSATNTDISSYLTISQWNIFEIVFNPGTDIKYYINGTLVSTHTTNLPTGSLKMFGLGASSSFTTYFSPITFSLEQ